MSRSRHPSHFGSAPALGATFWRRWVSAQFLAQFGSGRLRTVALRTFAMSGLLTVHRSAGGALSLSGPWIRCGSCEGGGYCRCWAEPRVLLPWAWSFDPVPDPCCAPPSQLGSRPGRSATPRERMIKNTHRGITRIASQIPDLDQVSRTTQIHCIWMVGEGRR